MKEMVNNYFGVMVQYFVSFIVKTERVCCCTLTAFLYYIYDASGFVFKRPQNPGRG